jgi:hypothetical protein
MKPILQIDDADAPVDRDSQQALDRKWRPTPPTALDELGLISLARPSRD